MVALGLWYSIKSNALGRTYITPMEAGLQQSQKPVFHPTIERERENLTRKPKAFGQNRLFKQSRNCSFKFSSDFTHFTFYSLLPKPVTKNYII